LAGKGKAPTERPNGQMKGDREIPETEKKRGGDNELYPESRIKNRDAETHKAAMKWR